MKKNLRILIKHVEADKPHPQFLAYLELKDWTLDAIDACVYAFAVTQNTENRSWSRAADVCRVTELPVIDGKEFGFRSSMVDDIFEIQEWAAGRDGHAETLLTRNEYRVEPVGFAKIEKKNKEQIL